MAYGQVNADVIGTSVAGSNLGAGDASLLKNRLINGSMVIDQRNAGASVTQTTSATYAVDRWFGYGDAASKFTMQQNAGSVTPPVGFSNYWGITSSSAFSITSTSIFDIAQRVEGYNIADWNWGSANAKTVTLSFWVRSSLTGTFGGSLGNDPADRSYAFSYTISAANTWEQKSITIAGDTTGTWNTTNGKGLQLAFGLGVGSTYSTTAGAWTSGFYASSTGAVSVVGTNGATWYITGVQLEVGSSATGFEYVNYQTSLANCQRYFIKYGGDQVYEHVASGMGIAGTQANCDTPMPVPMRTTPSSSISTLALNDGVNALITITSGNIQTTESSPRRTSITYIVASGVTTYRPYIVNTNNSTSGFLALSAEL
jgi:hypothetical protein